MGIKARIVASLLWKKGRLVKGVQMKDHKDAGNPATTIKALCAQGIDEILLLDISEGAPHWDALESAADGCTVPLTFGGGLENLDDVQELLQRGGDRAFVPIRKRALVEDIAGKMGRQAVVVGVDGARGDFIPGIEHRLLDPGREGTRAGFNLAFPKTDAPLIIEGGAGKLEHIAEAFKAGASAVALGTMLVFGDNNILKIKRYLKAQGIPVRL